MRNSVLGLTDNTDYDRIGVYRKELRNTHDHCQKS